MAHLYTAYKCRFCSEIPDSGPLYHCINRHQYCHECFRKLQRLYHGSVTDGSCCLICKYTGKFDKSEVTDDFLKKLKAKPGKTRRYNPKLLHFEDCTFNNRNTNPDNFRKKLPRSMSAMTISKRPLICLHNGCNKSVAISCYVNHYRTDHSNVATMGIERGKDLEMLFDVSLLKHGNTHCLAMVTAYDCHKIDVGRSKSSQSVINTCSVLSGRVPLNTFWLMMSVSADHRKSNAYAVFWLYSNADERYWCTIELSSKRGKTSYSSFCKDVGLHEERTVEEVARNLNCLIVSHGCFLALLGEGDHINLRLTLH